MWAVSRALSRAAVDCLFFPTVYSYVPVFSRAIKLLMIHDVIAERLPEHVFPTLAGKTRWRLKVALARRQADWILTVSEFSRQALVEQFGLKPEKVKVIGEAPHPIFRQLPDPTIPAELIEKGVQPDSRLVTYVGGFSPHKNLQGLLHAVARIDQTVGTPWHLVLVGDYANDSFWGCHHELIELAQKLGLADRVTFTGYVPDEHLVILYNAATMLVLPSMSEGFGLPVVEAMACGLPVAVSNRSSLPDVIGSAGLMFDPVSHDQIAESICRLLCDEQLRRDLRAKGLQRAELFSWKTAGREMVQILEEVALGAGQTA